MLLPARRNEGRSNPNRRKPDRSRSRSRSWNRSRSRSREDDGFSRLSRFWIAALVVAAEVHVMFLLRVMAMPNAAAPVQVAWRR